MSGSESLHPPLDSACPCGSGRQYATCCLGCEQQAARRLHDRARGELEDGQPAVAVALLKQACALDCGSVRIRYDLGNALRELGCFAEAEQEYRSALSFDPAFVSAAHSLGELLRSQGRLDEARRSFEGAVRTNPAMSHSLVGLAQTLADLGDLEAAASCYRKAIERSHAPAVLYGSLGAVLWKSGDSAGALDAFERAVMASPDSAEAHYNFGSAQLESGRFEPARTAALAALQLRPRFPEAITLQAAAIAAAGDIESGVELLQQSLGADASTGYASLVLAERLLNSRLFEPARLCLEMTLLEQPAEARARHLLAALAGENPDHPAEGYVRQVFDASAATFDAELVEKLGYAIPRELLEAVLSIDGRLAEPWDVLDLGSGTGLVGVEFAPYSRRLVGVDLAPNMIERARARNVYWELHCADLMEALADEQHLYDIVTAADVFIYVGKLDEVIPLIRRVLRVGALFAFSVEAAENLPTVGSYRLGIMGRYAHRTDYLRSLATRHGFQVECMRKTHIRLEHRRPVEGWLTVWRAV